MRFRQDVSAPTHFASFFDTLRDQIVKINATSGTALADKLSSIAFSITVAAMYLVWTAI